MGKVKSVDRSPSLSDALQWLEMPVDHSELWSEIDGKHETNRSQRQSQYRLDRASLSVPLFSYQRELVTKILGATHRSERALVSLPTGAGKTRTALTAFLEARETNSSSRWIWLAPTLELLGQARDTLEKLWNMAPKYRDVSIGFRTPSPDGVDIWLTTPQTARSVPSEALQGYSVVLFDEAHQLGAPTYRDAVLHCESVGATVIGLSATPGRFLSEETEDLVDFFDRRLLTSSELGDDPVRALQLLGVLSRLQFRNLREDGAPGSRRERLRTVAARALDLVRKGRKVLVFEPSVAEAQALTSYLSQMQVDSFFVEGGTGDSARDASLSAFSAGTSGALVNSRLLATGYDCPAVSDVILGHRVGSPVLFEQMVGRAARGPKTGGSATARIWQFEDHLLLHGRPSSYYRYRDFEWTD